MSKKKNTVAQLVRDLARQAVEAQGLSLYHVDVQGQEARPLVRVYVEPGPDSDAKSVTLDECSALSRRLSALLEVEDPFPGAYVLEVSSPGLDRPLYEPRHYLGAVGLRVKLKTFAPLDGRRRFEGRLLAADDGESLRLEVDGSEVTVGFDNVAKAQVVFEPGAK